jgi:hypothetical protein
MERTVGVEPTLTAWKADTSPRRSPRMKQGMCMTHIPLNLPTSDRWVIAMPLLAYPRRQPSALLGGAIILLPAADFCYGYAVWGREGTFAKRALDALWSGTVPSRCLCAVAPFPISLPFGEFFGAGILRR